MGTRLLPDAVVERIVETCRDATGADLRSITFFTRDDFDQLYLRDDLARDADLKGFIGHEWYDFTTTQDAYLDSELGEYEYTIRSFANGYLARITTDRDGVFVTTDKLAIDRFERLAEELEAILEDR